MTEGRVTRDDLAWWLEFAAGREWTFAKPTRRPLPITTSSRGAPPA